MVRFGDWQQEPDFPQDHTITDASGDDPWDGMPLFDYALSGTSSESGFKDPVDPISNAELEQAVESASPQTPEGQGIPTFDNLWGTDYSWGYELSTPNWNAGYAAGSAHRWCRITPRTYLYAPTNRPDDAIGVDYETLPYDPADPWQSAPGVIVRQEIAATSQLRGFWRDESVTPAVVPEDNTRIMLRPVGDDPREVGWLPPPATSGDADNPQVLTLGAAIDLTPYMRSYGWAGDVWTLQTAYRPPANGPGPYTSGLVRYGWGFDRLTIQVMVRPPRYRWVLAGPVTYRRVFPRDDGLAGGSPRTFPRSKSTQSGNRTFGGYL